MPDPDGFYCYILIIYHKMQFLSIMAFFSPFESSNKSEEGFAEEGFAEAVISQLSVTLPPTLIISQYL